MAGYVLLHYYCFIQEQTYSSVCVYQLLRCSTCLASYLSEERQGESELTY